MLDKLKNIISNEFKNANLKSFFFFLILSTIIWLFVQFSKPYNEILSVPIKYRNYPEDKIVKATTHKLRVRVKQSGFELIWFKVFRPSIDIDLSALPSKNDFLQYNVYEHHKELVSKMPIDFTDAKFLTESIEIPFAQKAVKIVKIEPKSDIQYAPGYSSAVPIKLNPDSVKISGPQSSLDTIEIVYTQTIKKKKAKKDIEEEIGLQVPNKAVNLFKDKVKYFAKVDKFTERRLNIPISMINTPPGTTISLYPSMAEVTFSVSLKRFKQIQGIDFKIVCDYKDIQEGQDFLIPKIVEKPDNITNIDMFPQKIQYVLKK